MKTITVSAPGKLMLFGEHAVVYHRPCLVTAVSQRMNIAIAVRDEPTFSLEAPDVKVTEYKKSLEQLGKGDIPKEAKFVEVAVFNFYKKFKIKKGLDVKTKSEFSALFGFGSSSAAVVCVIKALSEIFGPKLNNKQIFDLSYKTVLDVQKKGSGFDVAAATYGGTLYFVTGGKVIQSLSIKRLPLIIGYSGVKADTVTLMNQVTALTKKYPNIVENVYDQIAMVVEQATQILHREDWQTLGELMNINQGYLEVLGVGSDKLSNMIYASRSQGAYGAKLSGAGGGDCMIALAPEEKREAVKKAIENAGGAVIDVSIEKEGVRIEE